MLQIIDEESMKEIREMLKDWLYSGRTPEDLAFSIYLLVNRRILADKLK